ncbi:LytR/AlgR family response regulator transcription factor [Niastella populi]|uniref:DNA-binding response regulator n=1 Tax=Niastella populi TaxID=550983 RepID=A0A1V9EKJ9_9BACT|nr:LytTR family DNA-binding domain-containing protein [Niastella populi]OQP46677.1 DNA-binding response regulator [Niastella populi]
MRCIIVDDEPLVRELLEDNIRQVPFLELVSSCKSATEALAILQNEQVDLVFLDIQMPRLSGLQLLQSLTHPPVVIIISAYEKYAVEGFNLQVADYILKPFSFDRFLKACNRAAELFRLKKPAMPEETAKNYDFFVNVEYSHVKIIAADILYIESDRDYIKIYLSSAAKPVITRMSLKSIEAKLPEGAFIRTHKSFLVAVSKITTIKRDTVCIGSTEIPVSETFRENINRVLKY